MLTHHKINAQPPLGMDPGSPSPRPQTRIMNTAGNRPMTDTHLEMDGGDGCTALSMPLGQ